MVRTTLALAATVWILAACQDKGHMAGNTLQPTELAAYAASTSYPGNARSEDPALGAIVQDNGNVRIVNFSNQSINDTNVWVNQEYVYRVPTLPAKSIITLQRNWFFNSQGRDLSSEKNNISLVQVQTGEKLITLQGPVREPK